MKSCWLLFVIACLVLRSGAMPQRAQGEATKVETLQKEKRALADENRALKQENERLKREVATLQASLAEKSKKDARPADPLQPGSCWRGKTQEDNAMKAIRVTEHRGDVVVFEVEGYRSNSLYRISGKLSGNTLLVDDVDCLQPGKGVDAIEMEKPSGSITLLPAGKLSVNVEAKERRKKGALDGWRFVCSKAEPAP